MSKASIVKIDESVVRKVIKLARLQLTDEEVKLYTQQLEPVLEHIDRLSQINTDNVKPTFQVTDLVNVFRKPGTPIPLTQKQALSAATKTVNGFIATKLSIEK